MKPPKYIVSLGVLNKRFLRYETKRKGRKRKEICNNAEEGRKKEKKRRKEKRKKGTKEYRKH